MKTTYTPQPLDTSRIKLSPDLLQLTELLAKNTHDIWAAGRIAEGWHYGAERNDARKLHPCLVPYDSLPESEKEYDRRTAMETLKAIEKLGFEIHKNTDMKNFENWTKEEFYVFLMLYAANADGQITRQEQKTVLAKANTKIYDKISEQFAETGDYDCLQNILNYRKMFFDSENAVNHIIDEIKKVFFADNTLSGYEKHIIHLITKILN